MSMSGNTVVFFSCLLKRIDMDDGRIKVAQFMQKAVVDLPGYRMPLLD